MANVIHWKVSLPEEAVGEDYKATQIEEEGQASDKAQALEAALDAVKDHIQGILTGVRYHTRDLMHDFDQDFAFSSMHDIHGQELWVYRAVNPTWPTDWNSARWEVTDDDMKRWTDLDPQSSIYDDYAEDVAAVVSVDVFEDFQFAISIR